MMIITFLVFESYVLWEWVIDGALEVLWKQNTVVDSQEARYMYYTLICTLPLNIGKNKESIGWVYF